MIPVFPGTSLIFVFFSVPDGGEVPRSRRSVSLHEKEEKIGADRQGTSPAPGSWQQRSATNLDTLPATIMEFRHPDWTDGSPVWAAWPFGFLATRVLSGFIPPSTLTGPVAKGGGRWLGRRRGTVRVWSPLPFKQPVRCPPTATPFLSFLYLSSELSVAVQSLVNDALLLLTTLQFPGLHSLYRCLDLGDTPQLAPALGLFTCFDLPTYAPRR